MQEPRPPRVLKRAQEEEARCFLPPRISLILQPTPRLFFHPLLQDGGGGGRNSPHLYNGGTKVGGIPSGWPCLPSSGAGFLSSGDQ